MPPSLPGPTGCPRESREPGDLDVTGFEPILEVLPNPPQKEPSRGREEEGKPEEIGENSGGKKEGPSNQDRQAIEKGAARQSPFCQLSPDLPERPEPFQARQGRTGGPRQYDEPNGRPEADQLAHLDEDEEFQEGKANEEEAQKG